MKRYIPILMFFTIMYGIIQSSITSYSQHKLILQAIHEQQLSMEMLVSEIPLECK